MDDKYSILIHKRIPGASREHFYFHYEVDDEENIKEEWTTDELNDIIHNLILQYGLFAIKVVKVVDVHADININIEE